MLRSILSPLLVFSLLLAAALPSAAQVEKAVYKLGLVLNNNKWDRDLDGDVLNAATRAFFESRRFTMVERAKLDAVFTEKDLQGFLGKGNQELSDVLGLDFIGLVAYTVETRRVGDSNQTVFTIEVRLVDVKTGTIVGTIESERPSFTPPSTPREAGHHLFENVREAFPPFGYIVKVTGRDAVVDLGSEAGVKEGDTLEIVREGEQIIHPVSGEVLPADMIVIGELKVLSTSPQISNCKFKSRDGGAPLGSTVRLKEENGSWKEWVQKGRGYAPWIRRGAEIIKNIKN